MTEPVDGFLFREVTMTEAHKSWNRLIKAVVDTDTPVTLTRYGKPVAILSPHGWYQRLHAPQNESGATGRGGVSGLTRLPRDR